MLFALISQVHSMVNILYGLLIVVGMCTKHLVPEYEKCAVVKVAYYKVGLIICAVSYFPLSLCGLLIVVGMCTYILLLGYEKYAVVKGSIFHRRSDSLRSALFSLFPFARSRWFNPYWELQLNVFRFLALDMSSLCS